MIESTYFLAFGVGPVYDVVKQANLQAQHPEWERYHTANFSDRMICEEIKKDDMYYIVDADK